MAEWLDTKTSIKLGVFWSQLEVSCVFGYTEKLWYNETVCGWQYIYIYIYIYVCVCVYFGSISSLIQISLNIIDILCLHIFFWIHSNSITP